MMSNELRRRCRCLGSMGWSDEGFCMVGVESHGFSTEIFSDKISDIEILGNIYRNPELLTS